MGLIQLLKIFMLKFSMEQVSNLWPTNVGIKLMMNTILSLAIILIISKEARDDYYYRFDWYNLLL
jgi:hypothetical protein